MAPSSSARAVSSSSPPLRGNWLSGKGAAHCQLFLLPKASLPPVSTSYTCIHTWQDLAKTKVETLKNILKEGGDRFAFHEPTTWPEQASLAAAGD